MLIREVTNFAGKALPLAGMVFLAACNTSGSGNTSALDETEQQTRAQKEQEQVNLQRSLRGFCPKTVIREGTESFRIFDEGVKRTDPGANGKIKFQSTISEVARECNYVGETLNLRVGIKGRTINGPSGATGTITMPIRVAVATAGKEVLYSVLHQVPVTIPEGGSNTTFSYIDGEVNVPAPKSPNLIVFVGFDEGPPEG